jgi:hypothetical protein
VKTIITPLGPMRSDFALRYESCKKDVERVFGMLQSEFAIVRYSSLISF